MIDVARSPFRRPVCLTARWMLRPIVVVLVSSFLIARPACAQQVELDKKGQDIVESIGFVADKIPYLGDIFSIATKLLFTSKEEPGYEQMKSEFEAFTTQSLENARVTALLDGRDGFKAILQQINRIDRPGAGDVKTLVRDKWKHLETELVKDIDIFHSSASERAMPTVTAYGEMVNLHLDTYLRLIALTDDVEDRLVYVNEFNHHLYIYQKLLGDEIAKAAKERGDLVTVARGYVLDNGKSVERDAQSFKSYRYNVARQYRIFYQTVFGVKQSEGNFEWTSRVRLNPDGTRRYLDRDYPGGVRGFPKFNCIMCPECRALIAKGSVYPDTHIWYTVKK